MNTTLEEAVAASPYPASTQTGEGERFFRAQALIYLAGPAAERRCLQGREPGWRRWRSRAERTAFHEVGHGLAGHLLGRHVYVLSTVPDESVRVQKTQFSAGHAWIGTAPEPPGPFVRGDRAETDMHSATKACAALALLEPTPYCWKTMLRVARRMRGEARQMVDTHWHLLMTVAEELVEHRELDRDQIARFLRPETRGSWGRRL